MKFNKKTKQKLLEALTSDLVKKKYQQKNNPLAGHCYVASEALYHLFPGRFTPCYIKHEGIPHWFLKESGMSIVDMTVGQFLTIPNYEDGISKGFLTKKPSKRAQIVIDRIKNVS